MLVQYCSDLHLEFEENRRYMKKNPLQPSGEILLLGGDILPFVMDHQQSDFINYVADNFEAVYWIPGNHEFYGSDICAVKNPHSEKIRSNVFLLNNTIVKHNDIHVICSTLWSQISPDNQFIIQQRLTDFDAIKNGERHFTVDDFNQQHNDAIHFISEAISNLENKKLIILTHHVPTFDHYPNKYKSSPVNQGFATELHNLIERSKAGCWIYGHHHSNQPSFNIGKTQLLTNQLGYVSRHEHRSFKRNACFDI